MNIRFLAGLLVVGALLPSHAVAAFTQVPTPQDFNLYGKPNSNVALDGSTSALAPCS